MKNLIHELFSLEGKVALLTGGAGELCGTMAEGMAGAGAHVLLADLNEERGIVRRDAIRAAGGKADFIQADISTKPSLEKLLQDALAVAGKVDILLNGAGINSATPFFEVSEQELDKIMGINFRAVYLGCQVFGKYLVERGEGGSIINVGSTSGVIPLSRVFTYSASKAAVHNLSKNLAREWAPHRVRVNTLVPGFFPAEQNRKVLTPDRVEKIMGHTPMNRFGEPRELVGGILLLASDAAGSFVTGIELAIDGGYSSMTI